MSGCEKRGKKLQENNFFLEYWLPNLMHCVEVLVSSRYDEKADVFSFAISFFEVLTCKKPYSDNPDKTSNAFVFTQAVKDGMRPGPPLSEPKDVVSLIISCWEVDPVQRPSIKNVYEELESIIQSRFFI